MFEKFKPLAILQPKHKRQNNNNPFSMLNKPGDTFTAHITKTYRQVIKIRKNNGLFKYSATKYPNGTIVETRTRKKK